MRSPEPSSWASDLCHPLPLAAVAVLAINDHLLKGRGLLPGAVTGKLSDVAGLFFFPLLLAAIARGAASVTLGRDLGSRRALALLTMAATGGVFTLLKLHGPFNAWVTAVWGVNVMDPTDLWALPVLPLSAAFMLRDAPAEPASPRPARRLLDLAAVSLAAMASMATSQAPPEPRAPMQPQPAVVLADVCASISASTCERSAGLTYLVVDVNGLGPDTCSVEVLTAREVSPPEAAADLLPAPLRVDQGQHATFALSFPKATSSEDRWAPALARLDLRVGGKARSLDITAACKPR